MKIKKIISIFIACLMLSVIAIGCSSKEEPEENTAPVIIVTNNTIRSEATNEVDVLQGVSAQDVEDGDLTDKIIVTSSPELTFTNGKATPTVKGTYEIVYSVTDSKGETAQNYATLKVTAKMIESLYKDYVFNTDDKTVNTHDFTLDTIESAKANVEYINGRAEIAIENNGANLTDVQFAKEYDFVKETVYKISAYVRSSNEQDITLSITSADAVIVKETIKTTSQIDVITIQHTFTEDFTGSLVFDLGKDLTTETSSNTIYIEKIHVITTVGEDSYNVLYSQPFDEDNIVADKTGINSVVADYIKEGTTLSQENGKFKVELTKFGTDSFNNQVYINTGIDLVKNKKYRVSLDVNAEFAHLYELTFEDSTLDWQVRAAWSGGAYVVGENKISLEFIAGCDITGLYLNFNIGKANEGVTSNTLLIDNVKIEEVTVNKVENKQIIQFNSLNKDSDFGIFNGTDEGNANGIGNAYYTDTAFVYNMIDISTSDWHNKMFIKKLALEDFASYRVEFTVESNVDGLNFSFYANPVATWSPKISEGVTASKTAKTYSFTMDKIVTSLDMEFIFQIGSEANQKLNQEKGDIQLIVSQFTVYKLVEQE